MDYFDEIGEPDPAEAWYLDYDQHAARSANWPPGEAIEAAALRISDAEWDATIVAIALR